jgi:serine/threonine protein kinase
MNEDALSPFARRLRGSRLLAPDQLGMALTRAENDDTLAEYLLSQGLLTRFQVRQLRAGATSLTVGNYIAEDFLGRGGGGVVFKARNRLMPGRYVALKTLDVRNLHYTPETLARFRREIEIVSRLDHPNLVRALDVIHTRSHWYLVLEYVPGQDLGTVVKEQGPLPVSKAVDYIIQAARGLAYAHDQGIVHRDVKPTNLLLTRGGLVKLTDLGLARSFGEKEDGLTMRGACLGTPEFMAPEQAEDARTVGPLSDLFGLGATLFHLLTGQLHLGGSTYLHKLQALLAASPRPLAEARPDVPPGLAQVVDRLRARDPAQRHESAREVITDLEAFATPKPSTAPEPLSPRQLAALVVDLLQGRTTSEEAQARHGFTATELERSRQRFLEGGERALEMAANGSIAAEQLRDLHARLGAQALEIEALRKQLVHGS